MKCACGVFLNFFSEARTVLKVTSDSFSLSTFIDRGVYIFIFTQNIFIICVFIICKIKWVTAYCQWLWFTLFA